MNRDRRPHICVLCGADFTTWAAVNEHLQSHGTSHSLSSTVEHKDFLQSVPDVTHLNTLTQSSVADVTHLNTSTQCAEDKGSLIDTERCVKDSGQSITSGSTHKRTKGTDRIAGSTGKQAVDESLYTCSFCDEQFSSMLDVCNHMHTHKDESVQQSSSLKHESLQLNENAAESCKLTVERDVALALDIDKLGKTLQQTAGSATPHRRQQAARVVDKPHKCGECPAQFVDERNFQVHLLTHTGQRSNKYPKLSSLKSHMHTAHSEQNSATPVYLVKTEKHEPKANTNMETNTAQDQEADHSCVFCGAQFESKLAVDKHMIDTSGSCCKKGFEKRCSVCKKQFFSFMCLKAHMMTHTVEERSVHTHKDSQTNPGPAIKGTKHLVPDRAMVTIKSQTGVEKGQIAGCCIVGEDKVQKYVECPHCKQLFAEKRSLAAHVKTHQKRYKCSYCSVILWSVGGLRCHERIHTRHRPHKCSLCNTSYEHASQLTQHMDYHARATQYKCSQCSEGFPNATKLHIHVRAHANGRPHQCDVCNKRFPHPGDLSRHLQTHTGEKPYQCSVCSKRFANLGGLREHEKVHTGETAYRCPECSKRFRTSSNRDKHMLIHSGEKLHQCSVCSKRFTQPEHLKRHRLTHTGETPYSCPVCYKACSQLGNLRIHMLIHTGETPHRCSVCKAAFRYPAQLKAHMGKHTGEKVNVRKKTVWRGPFRPIGRHGCFVCSSRYSRLAQLRSHMLLHETQRTPFVCSHCDDVFIELTALRQHKVERVTQAAGRMCTHCDLCVKGFLQREDLEMHLASHLVPP